MSFGFLTESALLPSKSKPIKVDGRSLVDLKAVVYAKEQKVKLEGGGSGGLRGLRGKRRAVGDAGDRSGRKDPFARSNRGVEDRSQRDELERVTASKKRKAAQRVMVAKSSLYEKMAKGEVAGVSRAGSLVDFSLKTGDDLALLEAMARKPKSRRHNNNNNGDGKAGPGADIDDDDDDDHGRGGRSKSSKKRPRGGRASGGGGKGRGGGGRSDSGKDEDDDDDSANGRGGYFSDDDDGDGDGDGGGGGHGAEVEIVDEFGRHRTVARGSREHRESLQAKKRAAEAKAEQRQQQSEQTAATAGSASSSFDDRYSYRGNRGAPPPPPPPPPSGSSSSSYAAAASGGGGGAAASSPGGWAWSSGAGRGADAGDFETREGQERQAKKGMAELLEREGAGGDEAGKGEGGAKILSQWEKTLTGDQKTYLREVQQETEAVRKRATAAGGDRKTDREKQRSERKELLRRKQEARAARLRGESA